MLCLLMIAIRLSISLIQKQWISIRLRSASYIEMEKLGRLPLEKMGLSAIGLSPRIWIFLSGLSLRLSERNWF